MATQALALQRMSSREAFVQLIEIDVEFLNTVYLPCQHRLSE